VIEMTTDAGSARSTHAARDALSSLRHDDTSRQSSSANRGKQLAILVIGLAAVARLPGNRRAQQHAIMLAIVLAAMAGLARDSQARSFERLTAWDKRRNVRYLRTAKAVPGG
jgi:hypothetical protein